MRKTALILLINIGILSIHASEPDSTKIKKGFNIGVLPAITYDSDLGFQYGGLLDIYHYGDGTRFPQYNHKLYLEASAYTKGSSIFRIAYDTDDLIKGIRVTAEANYVIEQTFRFNGFNGYQSKVNYNWTDDNHNDYKSRVFYNFDRRFFRSNIFIQGKLNSKLKWLAGIGFYNIKCKEPDINKLNKGQDNEDKLPSNTDMPGLYKRYIDWDIIPENEKDGGNHTLINAGIVYDTRNKKANPSEGIWAEAILSYVPDFLSDKDQSYTKAVFVFRHYINLIKNRTNFAYRIKYQSTIGGKAPFYMQNEMIKSFHDSWSANGLGGTKTIRGITRSRIVADGFLITNLELRNRLFDFRMIKQNFYLGLVLFSDFGVVTDPINIDTKALKEILKNEFSDYFSGDIYAIHSSVGLGIKIAMNENFIISTDYGLALDKRDGKSGFYIGLNYLF